jgi:transposase
VAEAGPRVLGVDDFALRKGVRYGTILIDLERRCPVDLLPDRKAGTLAQWLKEHPGAEVVARDRAAAYAEGIRQGAPAAAQVADRWHLLKNLTDALEALLTREHRALQQAAVAPEAPPLTTDSDRETPESLPRAPVATRERRGRSRREVQDPLVRRERRLARYEAVMEQFRQGRGVREIARHLQMSRTTVAKYLRAGSFPERKVRVKLPTQVTPYAAYLERRWQEGCHNSVQLWREIQAQGFAGGKTAVYRFTAPWREARSSSPRSCVPPLPAPRTVLWWLVGEPEQLTEEQRAFTDRLLETCVPVKTAVELGRCFFELVRERQGERLTEWVAQAEQSTTEELAAFARGLRADWDAVLAGMSLPWSSGPVEGQVTRLKLIKRQMYGRASFDLLRARVLPLRTAA